MIDFLGRLPLFDSAVGMPIIPAWIAGALAAVFVVLCLLAFNRAGRESLIGGVARVGLVLLGAGLTWFVLEDWSRRDLASERRALDVRATQLTLRAIMPGSALACLNGPAGDTVEASCEKALFATPEATAAAVSFVSAQLGLLADAADFARRDPSYNGMVKQLRHSAEIDRFGIVAHVLAAREGCTTDQCGVFALLNDASRVRANLAEHRYDSYVARYAAGWPAIGDSPVARSSLPAPLASAPDAAPGLNMRAPGPNVFFPSAASIPPVNIMNAEPPPSSPETTGAAPAVKPPPAQRKAPARRPVDINAESLRAAPPAGNVQ
jgi:hypothetical protein